MEWNFPLYKYRYDSPGVPHRWEPGRLKSGESQQGKSRSSHGRAVAGQRGREAVT